MYQTFMNAYTLVDSPTRRKLDEMLKTWKEPVPGSLDTRPVFAPEITRSIESALIKARTAALQQQQGRGQQETVVRGRGVATPPGWSHTPTPPQGLPRPPPSFNNGTPTGYQHPPHQEVDLGALNRDIGGLISAARIEFTSNPLDPSIQQRLRALLDLQGILQRQELTPGQLKLVRDQVSALAPTPSPVLSNPPSNPSVPAMSTPMANPPQSYQHLLNQGTLAELIKATAARQQPTPPPQSTSILPQVPQRSSTPQPVGSAPENPLIASLKARGLLPGVSSSSAPAAPGPSLASVFPFVFPGQAQTPSMQLPKSSDGMDVQMNTASIKMYATGNVIICTANLEQTTTYSNSYALRSKVEPMRNVRASLFRHGGGQREEGAPSGLALQNESADGGSRQAGAEPELVCRRAGLDQVAGVCGR